MVYVCVWSHLGCVPLCVCVCVICFVFEGLGTERVVLEKSDYDTLRKEERERERR